MAIPKKIHWCWLSGDPLPKYLQKCVESWKRVMPDYEIILWDKNRFDIHSVKFVEDACTARKWAFAADYIRLYALYTEGGIYLDSDVRTWRRFDEFLHLGVFSSVEYYHNLLSCRSAEYEFAGYYIQAAILGAEKGHGLIKLCLEHYQDEKEFKLREGNAVDVEPITDVLVRYAHKYYGLDWNYPLDKPQVLKDNIVIYPPSVFARIWGEQTMQSYAVHVGQGSWFDDKSLQATKKQSFIRKFYMYLCRNSRFVGMLHYKRQHFFDKS
ncbi:glycosyl transferase [Bacteroidia bacterium]|nr:glycosyl transferase [Bacteroidia bacterium]